jgi:FixJ family two-component response regulator
MVYVVDDDPTVRDSLSLLLSSYGHEVTVCDSAAEFLLKFTNENIGCIFLDMMMPEMTGSELFIELKRKNIYLPVIFLTGDRDIDVAINLMKDGAFYYLNKPINPDTLIDKLNEALSSYQEIGDKLNLVLSLSEREMKAFVLMVDNAKINDMANELHRSPHTIEKQRMQVLNKLDFESTADLYMFFRSHGIEFNA